MTDPEPPRDLAEGMFARSGGTTPVTLRLDPPARWVVEYYPVEEVRPQSDGGVEVDLLVADPRWLTRLLLRLTPHARVVDPDGAHPEFTQTYTAAARSTLGLYT